MTTLMKDRAMVALACKKAGGMRALARAIDINYQSIQVWKKIPAERVIAVEAATGIPREQLRPELYLPKRKITKTNKAVDN